MEENINNKEKPKVDLTRVYVNTPTKNESYSAGKRKTNTKNFNKNTKDNNKIKSEKTINVLTDVYQMEESVEKNTLKIKSHRQNSNLKLMFLGGVGEIGKNMMALEYGDNIIIIDCGATFPNDDMPGIDLVVPDITYLKNNKDKIKGIVLTHGHEDHIGAIPFVLNDINTTIYGSRLALGLVENKLKEYPKLKVKMESVKERQVINLGCFQVEFIHVNHSIPGSMALAITTPVGIILHTGDFKIDFESLDEKTTDLNRFAELGKKGVLLYR